MNSNTKYIVGKVSVIVAAVCGALITALVVDVEAVKTTMPWLSYVIMALSALVSVVAGKNK